MKFIIASLLVLSSIPAYAQQIEMPPIDRELWNVMIQAIGNVSMPLPAHQQVQQILQNVEQQAAQKRTIARSNEPEIKDQK